MAKSDTYQSDIDTAHDSDLRDRISGIQDSASGQIDNSPLIAVGAGLALGAVLAAVLPATNKERELLGPIGNRISEAGTEAIDRGRDMAKQKFDEVAGDTVREVLGSSSSKA